MDRVVISDAAEAATTAADGIAAVCMRGFEVSLAAFDMVWQGRLGDAGLHVLDSFVPCYEALAGLIDSIGPMIFGS